MLRLALRIGRLALEDLPDGALRADGAEQPLAAAVELLHPRRGHGAPARRQLVAEGQRAEVSIHVTPALPPLGAEVGDDAGQRQPAPAVVAVQRYLEADAVGAVDIVGLEELAAGPVTATAFPRRRPVIGIAAELEVGGQVDLEGEAVALQGGAAGCGRGQRADQQQACGGDDPAWLESLPLSRRRRSPLLNRHERISLFGAAGIDGAHAAIG
ncbi:hypothetical protein D9M68_776740 [compost metagenome]